MLGHPCSLHENGEWFSQRVANAFTYSKHKRKYSLYIYVYYQT